MAREMVVNDLADRLRAMALGARSACTGRTNVPVGEWRGWVGECTAEAVPHATYREAIDALDKAVMASFYATGERGDGHADQ